MGPLVFNHRRHGRRCEEKVLSESVQTFLFEVSSCLNQLKVNLTNPRLEILLLQIIPKINNAFAKLVVGIDCPLSVWENVSLEEYCKYSLNLLGFLNSISSCVSQLSQARVSLCYGLCILEKSHSLAFEHLKPIGLVGVWKDWEGIWVNCEGRFWKGKDEVVNHGLMVLNSVGFWVCRMVLSGLCGDDRACLETRKLADGFGMDKGFVLKEVKEVNDAVASLVAALIGQGSDEEAKELGRRLEEFEKMLEGLQKEVDRLFSEVLTGRNLVLASLRQKS